MSESRVTVRLLVFLG